MNKTKKIQVSLSPQLHDRLKQIAVEDCRTPAGFLRFLLLEYLRKQEK